VYPREDAPGDVIGGCELLHIVGQGGMAVVWKARSATGELVAIKRLQPEFELDPTFRTLIVEEARVAATLKHRHIVALHSAGQTPDGRSYMILQWVHGVDLAHFTDWHHDDQRPTPWRLVTRIMSHVLRGLAAAHDRIDQNGVHSPVYHRDVSPGNVLLDVTGIARLADFGVARATDRATMTQPGLLKGKLGYAAPEALRGTPASVQSDLWSVGVVFWEALTADRLFFAKGIAQLLDKLRAGVPSLAERRPDVPSEIAALVHDLLQKQPDDRPVSAAETAAWLESQLDESSDERILSRAISQTMATPSLMPPQIEPTTEIGLAEVEELERRDE
jgi:eukaryotic-like serine/threonine-protein kinase